MTTSFVTVAVEAALRAGEIQRERYGGQLNVEHKGTIDLVTEVDRACEEVILQVLRGHFPDHDVLAEESGSDRRGSRYVWFVDPLDGTTNYAHAYPFFASSIALARDGELIAAAVYAPVRDELFTAERGAGARLNGAPLRTSGESRLIASLLVTGFPYDVQEHPEERLALFNHLVPRAQGIRRSGSAALDLCYVAAGRLDGFWEERLNPWDVLAGALLVEEAGGRVSRFDGSPLALRADQVVATNGPLHEAMLEELRGAREPVAKG